MRGQLVDPGGRVRVAALWYVGLTLALCSDAHTQAVTTVALLAVRGDLLLGVRRGEYDTQYVEILRLSRGALSR